MSERFWAETNHEAASSLPRIEHDLTAPTSLPRQVGRYFEHVHLAALRATQGVEVLATNTQIRALGRTLGELDVLYRRDGVVVHREIAIKFYLSIEDTDDPRGWIGPGKRDRLDLKLARLREHQLRMPLIARAHDAWPPSLPQSTRSEVLLLGAVFSPPQTRRLPRGANPRASAGTWWHAHDFVRRETSTMWRVLEKPWWLCPTPEPEEQHERAPEIATKVIAADRPLFVGDTSGRRGFVVPDGW